MYFYFRFTNRINYFQCELLVLILPEGEAKIGTVLPVYNELAYKEFRSVQTVNNLPAKLVLSVCKKKSSDIMFSDRTIHRLYRINFLGHQDGLLLGYNVSKRTC